MQSMWSVESFVYIIIKCSEELVGYIKVLEDSLSTTQRLENRHQKALCRIAEHSQ